MNELTKARIYELADQRQILLSQLAANPRGVGWCERHTDVCDAILHAIFDDLVASKPDLPTLAIIATGGYGRRELSVYSDLDLTIMPGDEASPELDSAVRTLFQDIHWAYCTVLRLDVGYAYRLLSDVPGLDAKTRTGLLDARLVAGAPELLRDLELELSATFSAGEFVLSKIQEREEMFARYHDTPLVVEPQLKEGAGGLRCFHCANWIREAIGERPSRPTQAYDTLMKLRNVLHLSAGKPQDLFTHQKQEEVAAKLGMDPLAMMSMYAEAASEVHRWYQRAKEKLSESRYPLANGVLAVQGEARLVGKPDAADAAVGVAIATRLGLRVSDIRMTAGPVSNGPAAAYACASGEPTLRNLDRCGLLDILLPELTSCRGVFPTDTVHRYTVFEHSMRVIRALDSIEPGTFLGDVRSTLNDLEQVYLAALLHDVGKIDYSKQHEEFGAELAGDVTSRWELSTDFSENVKWLVRQHLSMSRVIRIRDISQPQTIEEFANNVKDLQRLGMLTLLTWADVSAVSEGAWTPSQDTFLRELYKRTAGRLQGQDAPIADATVSRARLLRQLRGEAEDEWKIQRFLESLPIHYLTSTPTELVRLHMKFADKAVHGEPTVEMFHRNDLSATELTVCALDSPGLLSRMLGVFYAFELSVTGIRACTTMTVPATAIDVFTINFGGRPIPAATANYVSAALLAVAKGTLDVSQLLKDKGKDPERKQRDFKYTFLPGTPGILEIRAARGRGMPYRLSRLIADRGWNILTARLGQWAGLGAAAFYLVGKGHKPLTVEEVQLALQTLDSEGSSGKTA